MPVTILCTRSVAAAAGAVAAMAFAASTGPNAHALPAVQKAREAGRFLAPADDLAALLLPAVHKVN